MGLEGSPDSETKRGGMPRWRVGEGKTGDAVRVVHREGRMDWRDGSEVGHEGARRSPKGPEHGFQSQGFAGVRNRKEVGDRKGVW